MFCSTTSARHMRHITLYDNSLKGIFRIAALERHERLQICNPCRQLSSIYTRLQEAAQHEVNARHHSSKIQDKLAERDLFLSVLSASTTKRDAKSYLSRYSESKPSVHNVTTHSEATHFPRSVRIALVKIRALANLDDTILQGLAHTLSQLSLLGLSCVFVVDSADENSNEIQSTWREEWVGQADRLVKALENEANVRARRLDSALGVQASNDDPLASTSTGPKVFLQYPEMVFSAIEQGIIPVIPAIGHTLDSQRVVSVEPDEVVLALTRQLATHCANDAKVKPLSTSSTNSKIVLTIERIILLDPLGGFPSPARQHKSHVFINMLQEYEDVRQELLDLDSQETNSEEMTEAIATSRYSSGSPPIGGKADRYRGSETLEDTGKEDSIYTKNRYVKNLELLKNTLALLPLSASALLTTPQEAATLVNTDTDLGVITRRPKNPLIFNLLTDKPIVSSSLPEVRLGRGVASADTTTARHKGATFVKYGMPLAIVPDTKSYVWAPPKSSEDSLSLENIGIDLRRLVDLIEDSFGRPLNLEHYLNRIRGKLAGVIIAGDYDGGAILTWELPPGVPDNGSDPSRQRMVPYLDKFAVLKKSQGTGGVADIVFTAMVRTCFPNGVCWRSRKGNPVNKWYFERANGTWKIPDTQWTMFWTTPDLTEDKRRFLDYESVCRSVQPSWADHSKPAD